MADIAGSGCLGGFRRIAQEPARPETGAIGTLGLGLQSIISAPSAPADAAARLAE